MRRAVAPVDSPLQWLPRAEHLLDARGRLSETDFFSPRSKERGKPKTIVSDNGTELTSIAILRWADDHKVAWHYIAPGKPVQNAFAERCGTLQSLATMTRRGAGTELFAKKSRSNLTGSTRTSR
jgi:transposase InsO family protein